MIQNIKVDVIYYMCPSDFELEFNLCGCCRMRLLTDKAADRKSLISDMSRAIGRSRIAIICGPLFEKTGLIYTTARAIGRGFKTIENKTYGINSDTPIEIIENSFPLVTKDGTFGGLIIESGSQAIILLTESRSVRRTIMQTLIHPYIEEVSITPIGSQADHSRINGDLAGKHAADDTPKVSPTEDAVSDNMEDDTAKKPEQINENAVRSEQENNAGTPTASAENKNYNIDAYEQLYVLKTDDVADNTGADENPIAESDSDFFIESKRVTQKAVNDYAKNYVPSEKDGMFISGLEESYDDLKREQRLKKWTVALTVLLGVTAAVLIYYFLVIPFYYDIPYGEYLKILFGGN